MGSQFWDLDFTQGASHDPAPGIFLAHDFQDMDGEPGDFTVSEGHGHPLVIQKATEFRRSPASLKSCELLHSSLDKGMPSICLFSTQAFSTSKNGIL